jgi:carbamoyltransferase
MRIPAVIGVNLGHDAGAALVTPGELAVVEAERIVGRKHVCGGSADVDEALRRVVGAWLADPSLDVTAIALADYHSPKSRAFPPEARVLVESEEWRGEGRVPCPALLTRPVPLAEPFLGLAPGHPPVHVVRHHWAHAASAFHTCAAESAVVLCLDGTACFGESGLVAVGAGGELSPVRRFSNRGGPRFGLFYESFARKVFGGQFDTGKLLGLAAFGTPSEGLAPVLRLLLAGNGFRWREPDLLPPVADDAVQGSRVRYGRQWFAYHAPSGGYLEHQLRNDGDAVTAFGAFFPDEVEGAGRRYTLSSNPAEPACRDVAATLQAVFEEDLLHLARGLRRRHPQADELCFAGGCALNITANTRLVRESGFRAVHIPSCCNDSGVALGAALALRAPAAAAWRDGPRRSAIRVAYAGPPCGGLDALQEQVRTTPSDRPLRLRYLGEDELVRAAARLLAEGRVLAWVQQGAETGPRALGHRSIFASPLHRGMRVRVSERIKGREWFRPIAPICPEEDVARFFEGPLSCSPTMLFSFAVRPEHAATLAEVAHVDGTARVQSVHRDDNPLVHRLLREVGRRAGAPVLINTSLNGRGEPIANSVAAVLSLLGSTELDGAVFVDCGALCLKEA